MEQETLRLLADRSLVAAITHDHTRVWLLNEDKDEPVVDVNRERPEHRHVGPAQAQHGHGDETAEVPYFAEIASVLNVASNVVLVGHGTGKANAMLGFMEYIREHNPSLFRRIAATGTANVPSMTGAQIIHDARKKWRQAHI